MLRIFLKIQIWYTQALFTFEETNCAFVSDKTDPFASSKNAKKKTSSTSSASSKSKKSKKAESEDEDDGAFLCDVWDDIEKATQVCDVTMECSALDVGFFAFQMFAHK